MLRSILLAHELSTQQIASQQTDEFRSGFHSAITAVAVAMNISLGMPQIRDHLTR